MHSTVTDQKHAINGELSNALINCSMYVKINECMRHSIWTGSSVFANLIHVNAHKRNKMPLFTILVTELLDYISCIFLPYATE